MLMKVALCRRIHPLRDYPPPKDVMYRLIRFASVVDHNWSVSHGMLGGTLYVRSREAKVINHLGGTVIWQEWRDGKYDETRREVKPDTKENP